MRVGKLHISGTSRKEPTEIRVYLEGDKLIGFVDLDIIIGKAKIGIIGEHQLHMLRDVLNEVLELD